MISNLLLEAAFRSALLGLAVWIGLRVFAVRNVLAQKAAWGMVLLSALLMPLVLRMTANLPGLVIPSKNLPSFAALIPQPSHDSPVLIAVPHRSRVVVAPTVLEGKPLTHPRDAVQAQSEPAPVISTTTPDLDRHSASVISRAAANPSPLPQPQSPPAAPRLSLLQIAGLIYLAVAAILFARLLYGLFVAFHVWRSAEPVLLVPSDLSRGLPLRSSHSVASPVTIGSAVVLPSSYREWDAEKLRVVLAHERSHVRQGDFYLQLLAGTYAALAWFSPLGWWLKRKLSDLAEAISDRAGLEEAADRTSYAQVLLEFAAAPRPTVIGVAMARTGSLSRRIERLLNDASFRQAFAGTRRALAIVLIIPVTLFVATALVHVQAAGQQEPTPPVAPPPPAAPDITGVVAPQAPSPAPEPSTPEPIGDIAPVAPDAPHIAPPAPDVAPPPALAPVAPEPPAAPDVFSLKALEARGRVARLAAARDMLAQATQEAKNHSGYGYSYSSDGQSYAIVRGDGSGQMSFNGDIHTSDIDKARKQAHGDFLWFTRDGKAYFIDDPATISQIQAMYKPMEDIGHQQEELGKKQEALGKQQEELGKQQQGASAPAPDMSKEIAKIDEAMAKLKANQGKEMTQDQFGELQERLAELQARLGEIQGRIGERQSEFGERMSELGAQMGELGEQMGRLGDQQGKIAQEADRKVKSIIDQSLKNGKAHPVQ